MHPQQSPHRGGFVVETWRSIADADHETTRHQDSITTTDGFVSNVFFKFY